MQEIIQELSEPQNINSKLYSKLVKILKAEAIPPLKSQSNIPSANELDALNIASRALKFINEITKNTLLQWQNLNDNSNGNSSKISKLKTILNIIIKCTIKSIIVLESNLNLLQLQPLDYEKTISNAINRFIEIKCFNVALDLISLMMSRLKKNSLAFTSSKTIPKSNLKILSEITKYLEPLKAKNSTALNDSQTMELKLKDILSFSVKTESKSPLKVSIIVTMMINALRCWTESAISIDEKNFLNTLMGDHGLMKWCRYLNTLDSQIGGKHFEYVYRILYKSSMNIKNYSDQLHRRKASLYFCSFSNQNSIENLHDYILKFSAYFRKNAGNDVNMEHLVTYYRQLVSFLDLKPKIKDLKTISSFHIWIQDYIDLSKELGLPNDENQGNELLNNCINEGITNLNDFKSRIISVISNTRLSLSETDLQKLKPLLSNSSKDIDQISLYEESLKLWDESISQSHLQMLNAINSKNIENYNESCVSLLYSIFHKLAEIYLHFLLNKQVNSKQSSEQQLFNAIVEKLNLLAAQVIKCDSIACSNLFDGVEIIQKLASVFELPETFRWISATTFNVAGFLYSSSKSNEALKFVLISQELLRQLKTSEKQDDSEYCFLYCRRLDLEAVIYLSLEMNTQAISKMKEIIVLLKPKTKITLEKNPSESDSVLLFKKVVERYVKISSNDASSYIYIFDFLKFFEDLDVQLSVAEFELNALKLNFCKVSTVDLQRNLIDRILTIIDDKMDNDFLRARLLISNGHCCRESGQDEAALKYFEDAEVAAEHFVSPNNTQEKNIYLLESKIYSAVILNQLNKCTNEYLQRSVELLEKIVDEIICVNKITAISKLGLSSHTQKLYYFLDILVKFMDILNYPLMKVKVLSLWIKLLQHNTTQSNLRLQTISLLSSVGYTYTSMGYTGQAGFVFEQLKALLTAKSAEISNTWVPSYAFYLVSIGSLEKSRSLLEKLCPTTLNDDNRNAVLNISISKIIENVDIYHSQALCYIESGNLSKACYLGELAYTILKKAYSKKVPKIKNDDMKVYSTLSDSWRLSIALLRSYSFLGELYKRQGSVLETQFFYKRGLDLSKTIHSKNYQYHFEISLAELDYCRDQLLSSKEWLDQATEIRKLMQNDLSPLEETNYFLTQGEQEFRQNHSDESISNYKIAQETIQQIMKKTFIDDMDFDEKLALKSPEMNLKNGIKKIQKSVKVKPESKLLKYQCAILENVNAKISIRKGNVFKNNGDLKHAKLEFNLAQESESLKKLEQAELYGGLAGLRKQEIESILKDDATFEIFQESAMVLPWTGKQQAKTSNLKKPNKSFLDGIIKRIEACEKLYSKYYDLAFLFGSPQNTLDANHDLLYMRMLHHHFSANSEYHLTTLLLSAQFEIGKFITPKREFHSILISKIYEENGNNGETFYNQMCKNYEIEHSITGDIFKKSIIDTMPLNWVVCSFSLNSTHTELYITRHARTETSIICRLPLNRQFKREMRCETFDYAHVMQTWNEIMDENKSATHGGKECITLDEKSSWWKKRKKLDQRISNLLKNLEQIWLGAFKGIITYDPESKLFSNEILTSFKNNLTEMISHLVSKSSLAMFKKMAYFDDNLYRMLLELDPSKTSDSEIEDALYFVLDTYQNHGITIDFDELNIDSVSTDYRNLLQKIYNQRSIHMLASNEKHLILIFDKYLQKLPWENLPSLRSRSISRMPSISFLRDYLTRHNIDKSSGKLFIDSKSAYYILNPSKDLKNTQKEFENILLEKSTWTGKTCEAPTENELIDALQNKAIVMYFGHGGAEQYISGHKIRNLEKCAVTLLMGCSSGRLHDAGDFDSWGTAINYLMAGSPSVVANLWDVTDRDLDRFSKSMMDKWGIFADVDNCSLAEAVVFARNSCVLRYLVGASPIVYGIPVHIMNQIT